MARLPRQIERKGGWYHLYNRVAGERGFLPFRDPVARREFVRRLLFHVRGSCCLLAGFVLMSNHYHLVLMMQRFRRLGRRQLEARARHFYGEKWRRKTAHWSPQQWEAFNRRLFDLSALMRQFQSEYSRWYNRHNQRRGPLWASRFGSTYLSGSNDVRECLFYVELNPVRAGLVCKPEQWRVSSARWRVRGCDQGLLPLPRLFPVGDRERAYRVYRQRLLYQGLEPSRAGQASLPEEVYRQERRRGFPRPGTYLQRQGFFSNGVLLGSRERVGRVLEDYWRRGLYRRKRQPISHLGGIFHSPRRRRS